MVPRRRFPYLAAIAAALLAALPIANAQGYPSRTVRIVVGFPPGQAIDISARLMAEWLQQRLGQTFIVENRPGAAANVATEMVARSPADGYTLLVISSNNVINTTLYGTVDFAREIAPIATFGRGYQVLNVNNSVPVKTVPDLIALAKADPGKLSMASPGIGSAGHVAGEMFKMMTGVTMVHVPYRGSVPALTDLMSGQVQVMFDNLPSSIEHIRAGSMRLRSRPRRARRCCRISRRSVNRCPAMWGAAGLDLARLPLPPAKSSICSTARSMPPSLIRRSRGGSRTWAARF